MRDQMKLNDWKIFEIATDGKWLEVTKEIVS